MYKGSCLDILFNDQLCTIILMWIRYPAFSLYGIGPDIKFYKRPTRYPRPDIW